MRILNSGIVFRFLFYYIIIIIILLFQITDKYKFYSKNLNIFYFLKLVITIFLLVPVRNEITLKKKYIVLSSSPCSNGRTKFEIKGIDTNETIICMYNSQEAQSDYVQYNYSNQENTTGNYSFITINK